jgi:2-iminobutanoate/2-iminopropanoate deaminase
MQIALDPESGELSGTTAAEQARRCLHSVGAILAAGGLSFAAVIKTTVYLTDLAQFASVNEAYAEFFTGELPARSIVPVAALPKGALVAVEAIATLSE